ncbi:unnamed protein product, partial [Gulo gulo]
TPTSSASTLLILRVKSVPDPLPLNLSGTPGSNGWKPSRSGPVE